MKSPAETIEFKSEDKYYWKEKSDIKNHTERIFKSKDVGDKRWFALVDMLENKVSYGVIRIVHAQNPKEFFERQIRDVSFYKPIWIITWKPSVAENGVVERIDGLSHKCLTVKNAKKLPSESAEGTKRNKQIVLQELEKAKNDLCRWIKELKQEDRKYALFCIEARTYAYRCAKLIEELFDKYS